MTTGCEFVEVAWDQRVRIWTFLILKLSAAAVIVVTTSLIWRGARLVPELVCVRILSSCFLCLREQSLYTRGLMSHFDPSPRRTVIASEIAFHSHPGLSLFKRRR